MAKKGSRLNEKEAAFFDEHFRPSMKNQHVTQANLADQIGTTRPTVAMWMQNRSRPLRPAFLKIAEVLDWDLSGVSRQEDDPAPVEELPESKTSEPAPASVPEKPTIVDLRLSLIRQQVAEMDELQFLQLQEHIADILAGK
ncbi:helix-turn-helix domain-containing protein [Furfurilactobacillus curtus]|uniref:HTH cro/C1-type domain-containing protein n=1 Tax=Furfurilactobacillus curtus TaxID=1746200 RepID=A0ABQ5JQG9_9LACO